MQAEDGPGGISNVVTGLKGIKMVFGCVSWLRKTSTSLKTSNQLDIPAL